MENKKSLILKMRVQKKMNRIFLLSGRGDLSSTFYLLHFSRVIKGLPLWNRVCHEILRRTVSKCRPTTSHRRPEETPEEMMEMMYRFVLEPQREDAQEVVGRMYDLVRSVSFFIFLIVFHRQTSHFVFFMSFVSFTL